MAGQQYFATYVQDLEQDPFDVTDFVERLAWRINGSTDVVDVERLKTKFEEEIGSLQLLSDQFQNKIKVLDSQLKTSRHLYQQSLQEASEENAFILDRLKKLDNTMQEVSTKIVHLGDQLESVNAPRARAYEALQLIKHFDEFLADQPLTSSIFTDPEKLMESAEIISKLYSISQELDSEKFSKTQQRISNKYEEIQEMLIEEFMKTFERKENFDRKIMREITNVLSNFNRYNVLLDRFVEKVESTSYRGNDVFNDILEMCEKKVSLIDEIFPNASVVMSKLILYAYKGRLNNEVQIKLEHLRHGDDEQYLFTLNILYTKTLKLNEQLQNLKYKPDNQFITMITGSIFDKYLKLYEKTEEEFVNNQCSGILQRFYSSKGHQKRNLQSGGLQELKRDIAARLRTVENFGDETFLSEEVAINILQELKNAFSRCQKLACSSKKADLMKTLYELLVKFLYHEHVLYAVELALSGIPTSEPKLEPSSIFFSVVQQSSAITHLFVKQFDDSIVTFLDLKNIQDECVKAKNSTLRTLETRINVGIEKQINAITGYIRYILSTEQKKTDFKPDDESQHDNITITSACELLCRYINNQFNIIKESVDGENLITILKELGLRIYQIIFSHIKNYNYSVSGAMLLLCDLNEYRKTLGIWKISEINENMESLHALANLLVVVPENLEQACSSPLVSSYKVDVINSIISLRHDSKTNTKYLHFLTN
uniref:Exocyst complex component 5 n=1 Tax=Parastrongyloides trichosuri TaxID=131310 RepID=A0A0N4ZRT5_PARTI